MRLYLDTNVLAWFIIGSDELTPVVFNELVDYSNVLLTSSVCIQEFIHLLQRNRWNKRKRGRIKAEDVVRRVKEAGITIVSVDERHLQAYSELPIIGEHTDPNDRLIIAQAIVDKATLVSSDLRFSVYEEHGLMHLHNER